MKKALLMILAMAMMVSAVQAADLAKPEDLTQVQLAALIEAAVNVNLSVDSAGNWSDTLLEAAKNPKLVPYIVTYFGSAITVTRVGKVNAEGQLPVEFTMNYPQPTETKTKIFVFDKQVVRISLKADDFGDNQITVDASGVAKSATNRKVRDSITISPAQLDSLVSFLEVRAKAAIKGYDRITKGSVFKGFYYLDQNDLTITITDISKDGSRYLISAKVEFLYQHKTAGSYTVKGTIENGKLRLEKDQVISLPAGFGMIGYTGPINESDLSVKGTSVENVGIDFNLKFIQ